MDVETSKHEQPRLGPIAPGEQAFPFSVAGRFLLCEPVFSICPAQNRKNTLYTTSWNDREILSQWPQNIEIKPSVWQREVQL